MAPYSSPLLGGGRPPSDAAVRASLAANTSLRVRTGTIPASAFSGSLGVLTGQPVTTRAAARISLSRSSTCDSDVAGSHAAAAYSSAHTCPIQIQKWPKPQISTSRKHLQGAISRYRIDWSI